MLATVGKQAEVVAAGRRRDASDLRQLSALGRSRTLTFWSVAPLGRTELFARSSAVLSRTTLPATTQKRFSVVVRRQPLISQKLVSDWLATAGVEVQSRGAENKLPCVPARGKVTWRTWSSRSLPRLLANTA